MRGSFFWWPLMVLLVVIVAVPLLRTGLETGSTDQDPERRF